MVLEVIFETKHKVIPQGAVYIRGDFRSILLKMEKCQKLLDKC